MANKAKSTQGRKVEVSTSGGSGGTWVKIGQTSDIPLQTGSAQYSDATNYDSNEKEYISALDDVQDLNIPFQRVVDDDGQNMARDAAFQRPRPTLFFRITTGQGEVMSFQSEVGGWQVTGPANTVENGQFTVRPRGIVWTPPAAQGGA
ncbi:hypothetical protein P3W24_04000 [Luteibacter sp. PPL201]|uniref:Phage tail protein n=1 Tax=Luteibacter sahnii TaxID=3021977 RepID=A0ABT6B8D7_9GAMM